MNESLIAVRHKFHLFSSLPVLYLPASGKGTIWGYPAQKQIGLNLNNHEKQSPVYWFCWVGWLINIAMFYYDCVSLQSFTFSDCVSWNVRFGSEVSKSKLWELPAISGHLPLVRHCFHSFSLEGGRKLGQDVGLGVCNCCTNECRFMASRHMTLSSHTCLDYCN